MRATRMRPVVRSEMVFVCGGVRDFAYARDRRVREEGVYY